MQLSKKKKILRELMLTCAEEPFLSGQAMEPVNFHVKHSKPEFKPRFISQS